MATSVLKKALAREQFGHAYLFSGPRGCGKTTAARIVAKALNCLEPNDGEPCGHCVHCEAISSGTHLDVIEIDGASNRGIDEIRELKTRVNLAPFSARRKIYIIDEVHMLTEPAFNALLKTIEEPPSGVVFLLATTEPHRVPVTIRSRCQHIPFHRISVPVIVEQLSAVLLEDGPDYDAAALWEIARQADGSMRDALSLLEQAVALARRGDVLNLETVRDVLGGASRVEAQNWIRLLREDPAQAVVELRRISSRGVSTERFLSGLFSCFRDLWIACRWPGVAVSSLDACEEEMRFLEEESACWSCDDLRSACDACVRLLGRARLGTGQDILTAMILLEFTRIREKETSGEKSENENTRRMPQTPESSPIIEKSIPEERPEVSPEIPRNKTKTSDRPARESADLPARFEETKGAPLQVGNPPPSELPDLLQRTWNADLALCVALLDTKIIRTDEGWHPEFSSLLAEAYAGTRRPMLILAHAVNELWGMSMEENGREAGEPLSNLEKQISQTAAEGETKVQKAAKDSPQGVIAEVGSINRLLDTMEAEVLLVRNLASQDTEESDS